MEDLDEDVAEERELLGDVPREGLCARDPRRGAVWHVAWEAFGLVVVGVVERYPVEGHRRPVPMEDERRQRVC